MYFDVRGSLSTVVVVISFRLCPSTDQSTIVDGMFMEVEVSVNGRLWPSISENSTSTVRKIFSLNKLHVCTEVDVNEHCNI